MKSRFIPKRIKQNKKLLEKRREERRKAILLKNKQISYYVNLPTEALIKKYLEKRIDIYKNRNIPSENNVYESDKKEVELIKKAIEMKGPEAMAKMYNVDMRMLAGFYCNNNIKETTFRKYEDCILEHGTNQDAISFLNHATDYIKSKKNSKLEINKPAFAKKFVESEDIKVNLQWSEVEPEFNQENSLFLTRTACLNEDAQLASKIMLYIDNLDPLYVKDLTRVIKEFGSEQDKASLKDYKANKLAKKAEQVQNQ